jgi:hypothetical protein
MWALTMQYLLALTIIGANKFRMFEFSGSKKTVKVIVNLTFVSWY